MTTRILHGDCRDILAGMPDASVHMVCTSPPYWGLRDYGIPPSVWGGDSGCDHEWGDPGLSGQRQRNGSAGGLHDGRATNKLADNVMLHPQTGSFCQKCGAWNGALGLEPTPDLFVAHIVEVFREVRRVLRDDGTLWLNLGDSYASSPTGAIGLKSTVQGGLTNQRAGLGRPDKTGISGIKTKDMIGIPWMVAFALRADGWWLRKDIIWAKPNPMPESATDRPTSSHEHVFLLTKAEKYFFDGEAVREPTVGTTPGDLDGGPQRNKDGSNANAGRNFRAKGNAKTFRGGGAYTLGQSRENHASVERTSHGNVPNANSGRNIRDVWRIATAPFPGAHFATFAPKLAETCIKAGTSEKGCCATCQAPWKRITTKGEPDIEHQRVSGSDTEGQYTGQSTKDHDAHGIQNASDVKRRILAGMRKRTYDWKPSCECGAEVVPCTVLDPLGGAGTVGLVANRLGRDAILIDLNPEYCSMAERRLAADVPKPAKAKKPAAVVPVDGQLLLGV